MKKTILVLGVTVLFCALCLQAYFVLIPPPEPSFRETLAEVTPGKLHGWNIHELKIADTPEASLRISEFLNFDDSIFRIYTKGDTQVGLYIAYWSPGKASYRWAGAHTPDTCWVKIGWKCTKREYSTPFQHGKIPFQPAEYGVYETETDKQNVYFWHLVGGQAYGYKQHGVPNIFAALIDIKYHGLNLRKEQLFIRLSSNKTIDQLKQIDGFSEILDSLAKIGLATAVDSQDTQDQPRGI
jgi:hypothetical protein